jgi:hypothetical protein
MPRPFFPHTLDDVTRAVDGPFGLVVGDMPDGSLFVLKRDRRSPDQFELSHYADAARTRVVARVRIEGRVVAVNAFAERIGLGETLG